LIARWNLAYALPCDVMANAAGASAPAEFSRLADSIRSTRLGRRSKCRPTLREMPEVERPDIRPELREFLTWYEEVLGRIESGALVEPGEQERLTEEASAVAHLLDLLDSSAHERTTSA
jgi:hypothetical protein